MILVILVIILASLLAGGIIAIYTKKEIEQYESWLNYAEDILLFIISIFMISFYKNLFVLLLIPVGLVIPFLIDKKKHIFLQVALIGLAVGTFYNISGSVYLFSIVSIAYFILLSSIYTSKLPKGKNILIEIGKLQVIFIILSIVGIVLFKEALYQALALNFASGALLATIILKSFR
ncbi:MAG: hypothetical protein J7K73_02880 [Nanoarchaeota archaeon]|nr:hypothetical protein [Nanoarchaeota archaeon]